MGGLNRFHRTHGRAGLDGWNPVGRRAVRNSPDVGGADVAHLALAADDPAGPADPPNLCWKQPVNRRCIEEESQRNEWSRGWEQEGQGQRTKLKQQNQRKVRWKTYGGANLHVGRICWGMAKRSEGSPMNARAQGMRPSAEGPDKKETPKQNERLSETHLSAGNPLLRGPAKEGMIGS